jgi:hypothetical protein
MEPASFNEGKSMSETRSRLLTWYLRIIGTLDCFALIVVFLPRWMIHCVHGELGMGTFPQTPIAGYLARSASLMYVLHGLLVLALSRDVRRYLGLIQFFAWVAVAHGALLVWIDWLEEMPTWWTWSEGPLFAASGVGALLLVKEPRTK